VGGAVNAVMYVCLTIGKPGKWGVTVTLRPTAKKVNWGKWQIVSMPDIERSKGHRSCMLQRSETLKYVPLLLFYKRFSKRPEFEDRPPL
jgi:hypothetical protein